MNETGEQAKVGWFRAQALRWAAFRNEREEQVFLALTLMIGALVGLVVVAFIVLTERLTPVVMGSGLKSSSSTRTALRR